MLVLQGCRHNDVIDLKSGKTFKMALLPKCAYGATGGCLPGCLPMVCGGYDNDLIHSIGMGQPTLLGQLSTKRCFAASVVLSNNAGLWVTGGFDVRSRKRLQGTEIITRDGKTSQGPDLPAAISSHTILALSNGAYFLIGGCTEHGRSYRTYFYEEKRNRMGWRAGPNLKNKRCHHSAGILTDRVTGKQYIVAAGGHGARHGARFEYLQYPNSNDWIEGETPQTTVQWAILTTFGLVCLITKSIFRAQMDAIFVEFYVIFILGFNSPLNIINGMSTYGTNLAVIGAQTTKSISTYQLFVQNGKFKWEKMKPKLKIGTSDCLADRLVGEEMPCHDAIAISFHIPDINSK